MSEGGRCDCRAEAGGGAGLLQGLGERRADKSGVGDLFRIEIMLP